MKQNIVVQGDSILELIPQRHPIVMVDTFYGIEDGSSYTALTIKNENIFVEDGLFTEPGIVEHIAQSAAVRIGYIYQKMKQPVPLGFIGSVDKMKFNCLPKTGEIVHTEIRVIQEVFNITLISAIVKVNDEIIAEGKMKIFLNAEQKTE